jgi:hypothetical protein
MYSELFPDFFRAVPLRFGYTSRSPAASLFPDIDSAAPLSHIGGMAPRPLLALGAVVFALLGLYLIHADIARSDLESACTVSVAGTLAGGEYRAESLLHLPPGYLAEYDYVVDGSGYRGRDKLTAAPSGPGVVTVHYDPAAPVRSVLELGRWRVILVWGVGSLGCAVVLLAVVAALGRRRA